MDNSLVFCFIFYFVLSIDGQFISPLLSQCGLQSNSERHVNNCDSIQELSIVRSFYENDEFLCVVLDNRGGRYSNQIIQIKISNNHRIAFSSASALQNSQYRINGANIIKFAIDNIRGGLPNIYSVKLNTIELCDSQERIFNMYDGYNNRFLNDCHFRKNRSNRFANICESRSEILVESRELGGLKYWCIIILNDDKKYNENDIFQISFERGPALRTNYEPASAALLGDKIYRLNATLRIAFSPNGDYDAPNIRAIRINDENICNQLPNSLSAPKRPNTNPAASQTTPWPQISDQFTATRVPITTRTTRIPPTTTMQITQKQCTVPARGVTQRVSNGERVSDRYYPWHVSIFKRDNTASIYTCGGSIISNQYILTAAHCLHEANQVIINDRLFIRTGSNLRDGGDLYNINKKVIHDDYDFSKYNSDIALLQTKNEISYTRIVRPVCYTGIEFKYTNIDAWIPGWGLTENQTAGLSENLNEAKMPGRTHDDCRDTNPHFFETYVNNKNFCAGNLNATSICRGDSGGGLVIEMSDGWYIRGIASITPSKRSGPLDVCDLTQFVLFTDVVQFASWIDTNLRI